MLSDKHASAVHARLGEFRAAGVFKSERVLAGPQGSVVRLADGREVLNFCANNYLGLANHPALTAAAKEALDAWGFGLASVRFICGTQEVHKALEAELSGFLGTEDTILYSSCFDANAGLFETLVGEGDAVISDELNHASIIDGIRLSKAQRLRYRHADMADLERALREAGGAAVRLIATDGVFSMDGDIAPLPGICDLAERYDALVMVDDSHATGYLGRGGRGTAFLHGVEGRVDLVTTTFGKALGGASGGCASGRSVLIEVLRQRSRPYLFSNSLAPPIAAGVRAALRLLRDSPELPGRVMDNARLFKAGMRELGFALLPGDTAIVPVMLGDEHRAIGLAEALLDEGIYVIAFSHPVVPKGRARIRVQLSAAHQSADVARAVAAFGKAGRRLGLLG